MKIKCGVMIVKDGWGWGVQYTDGQATVYGWVPLEDADIHSAEFCNQISDAVANPHDLKEALTGKLVYVERITKVHIL